MPKGWNKFCALTWDSVQHSSLSCLIQNHRIVGKDLIRLSSFFANNSSAHPKPCRSWVSKVSKDRTTWVTYYHANLHSWWRRISKLHNLQFVAIAPSYMFCHCWEQFSSICNYSSNNCRQPLDSPSITCSCSSHTSHAFCPWPSF